MSAARLIDRAAELAQAVTPLRFGPPVTHVYNPLDYAWRSHRAYLQRFGKRRKQVVLMGMNPGPWGMAQTGVPFGEVNLVRDWMGIEEAVERPEIEHPKRPVEGFACARSEVSGRRLWGFFADHFPRADDFFRDHLVLNYCPLVFMAETGRNITPDKLPKAESEPLFAACDTHLISVIKILKPEIMIGIGAFAEARLRAVAGAGFRVERLLHPSPASPAANRDWAGQAQQQLQAMGLLDDHVP